MRLSEGPRTHEGPSEGGPSLQMDVKEKTSRRRKGLDSRELWNVILVGTDRENDHTLDKLSSLRE